jgi:hypothetical protein
MKICHIFYNGQQDYLESGNEADEPTPQEVLAVRIRLGQNFRWSFCDAPLALGLCLTDCAQRAFCWHFKVASKVSKYFSKTLYPACFDVLIQ